ncbi:MAG TPA: hypothetical protein VGD99_22300 [Anaerolineae bacterium]
MNETGNNREFGKAMLQLKLLGQPEIILNGAALTNSIGGKAQAALYYLALTGRPQTRGTLAGLLWGDVPEALARTSLRKALTNLRQTMGDYLEIDRQSVAFNPEAQFKVGPTCAMHSNWLRRSPNAPCCRLPCSILPTCC